MTLKAQNKFKNPIVWLNSQLDILFMGILSVGIIPVIFSKVEHEPNNREGEYRRRQHARPHVPRDNIPPKYSSGLYKYTILFSSIFTTSNRGV